MNKIFCAVCLGTLFTASCNDIESRVECVQICDKYADCYDSDYDVDKCAEECTDEYDADESYIEKIDDCDTCLEDKSCTESTFSCADECIGIVP